LLAAAFSTTAATSTFEVVLGLVLGTADAVAEPVAVEDGPEDGGWLVEGVCAAAELPKIAPMIFPNMLTASSRER
jgi:hypothetical protein